MLSIDCPRLFTHFTSSCSWRVRIALKLKKIEYLHMPVSMSADQQTNAFRQLNPLAQVPALQLDGHTLIDSIAIMHYLEETRPERPLLPANLYQRTQVRELCSIICSGIQPLQGTSLLSRVNDDFKDEFVDISITRGFDAVEAMLAKSAGIYCVGDQITMADCCLLPQVYNAKKFEVEMEPYPIIRRIAEVLEAHPDFHQTRPENQPDYPAAETEL